MFVLLRRVGLLGDRIEVDEPRLQLTDEMKNFHVVAESTQIEMEPLESMQASEISCEITVWMPEDKSSMLSSTYCRWMANASRCPYAPNRKSMSSTTLGHRRQNCLFEWQIVSASRMYHGLDDKRKRPNWNNLASQHLGQPQIRRVRTIHRNFAAPMN